MMGLNLIENGVDRAIAAVDKIRSMITGYDEGPNVPLNQSQT